MPGPLVFALLLSFSLPAFAIYKCEADGKTSYGDTPCPGGRAVAPANPAPPAAEAERAERQLAQQKAQLQRLESAREAREKREAAEERRRRQATRADAARQKKCAASGLRKKWAEEDAARADAKAAPKAQRTARRVAEKHELECGG